MNKKYFFIKKTCILLLTALVLSLQTSPAFSLPADSLNFFTNSQTAIVAVVDTAQFQSQSGFSDVKSSDWFYKDVLEAQKQGLLQGIGHGLFAPDKTISYAEYITALLRVTGKDVSGYPAGSHWASQSIEAAKDLKIVAGEFTDPDDGIPRQDMVKYVCKALKLEPAETLEYIFEDTKGKSEEDIKYINTAFNEYLTEGVGRNSAGLRVFGYDKVTKRSELATMLLRIKAYKADPVAYKKERAAIRAQEEKEWKERFTWEQLGKSGGITSESQLTPEVIEKIKSIKTEAWTGEPHVIGDEDGMEWKTPDDRYYKAQISAIKKKYANEKFVVTSKDLYFEGISAGTPDSYYLVILNGKKLVWVEVYYTMFMDGTFGFNGGLSGIVSDNIFD